MKKESIGIFGIGIFTYLCISSISYVLEELTRDILILADTNPKLNFTITEILCFGIFVLPIYVITKKWNHNYNLISNNIKKYLVLTFSTFLILQIIHIVYPYSKSLLTTDLFTFRETYYYEYLGNNYSMYFIKSAMYYFAMIISFLLIYKKLKNGSQQSV